MEFTSFGELARHATVVGAEIEGALHDYIKTACKVILEGTQETFGEYQGGEGPFSTWQDLAESTKDERVALGYTENDPLLRSGKLRDSFYLQVSGHEGGVGSELPQALGHEIGNPITNLPARSTVGIAFVRVEEKAFNRSNDRLSAAFLYGARSADYGRMAGRI